MWNEMEFKLKDNIIQLTDSKIDLGITRDKYGRSLAVYLSRNKVVLAE